MNDSKPNQPESCAGWDDPAESRRFIDMAREVGVDDDPTAFDRAFERLVRPKKSEHSSSIRRRIAKKKTP